jgi:hypothetical protein
MDLLARAFTKMGARVKFAEIVPARGPFRPQLMEDFSLDVQRDARGEYFLVARAPASSTELVVLDVQPQVRHLLLLSRSRRRSTVSCWATTSGTGSSPAFPKPRRSVASRMRCKR